jgi:catechol 2,3-dioxygenase-like lactoylglutathione lyase family enzyme
MVEQSHERPSAGSRLGHFLQGVQHVGITVDNLERSLEFYIEVLGGKLAVGETGLEGDRIQNVLFQKEEIDAATQGASLESLGVVDLREGGRAVDVRFVSFGNIHVELLHFRDREQEPETAPSVVSAVPAHIAHVNAKHLSFQVRESIDLNEFARKLEEECQRRGFHNMVFNRIVRVRTAEEQKAVAPKYNSFKFWSEPDPDTGRSEDTDWGDFEGWSLFYCKGPSGEQLEFNQVTRRVSKRFAAAQAEYDEANGTHFSG